MGTPIQGVLSDAERTRRIARVLWLTLGLNWITAILKILFGWTTGTMVILADGFHSLSDGTSNIVGLIGILISGQPADKNHPYGHHKYETLASIVIAVLLLTVAFGIFHQALEGLFHPATPQVSGLSFLVMMASLVINLFVVWYERRQAKLLHSELLMSDSWHTLTDVFITVGVFVALGGILLNLKILDSIVSLGIAAAIAFVAVQILRQSSDVLMDKAVLDPDFVERLVRKIQGVEDCHEVRTRGKSHRIYVDLHVLVEPHMTVEASHRLANRIEHGIRAEIAGVCDVVVHIEPTTHDHSELTGA